MFGLFMYVDASFSAGLVFTGITVISDSFMHCLFMDDEVAFLCGLVVTLWAFEPYSLMLVLLVMIQAR